MSLSSNRLNGHPTKQDPTPYKRAKVLRRGNGYPAQRQAEHQSASTPAEQQRRVNLAAANQERAIQAKRNKKLLQIYGVPEPVRVPGENGLFSRWLHERNDKRTRFKNLAAFCLYILEKYGDEAKDTEWRRFLGSVEPEPDQAEAAAEETLVAITAVETQQPRILATRDLPSETFEEEELEE